MAREGVSVMVLPRLDEAGFSSQSGVACMQRTLDNQSRGRMIEALTITC
jgi:hypothetical protein